MKATCFFCFFIALIFLGGCNSGSKELKVIKLDQPDRTEDLKFSEIADNLHCVCLENRPDLLLSSHLQLWAGEKYILTFSEKDIQQFASDGRHIRKLASAGKGPHEFSYLASFTVNEDQDILYYMHQGDQENIWRIDLKTGEPLPKLNIKYLTFSMQSNKQKLYFAPRSYEKRQPPLIYAIDPQGHFIDSIPNSSLKSGNNLSATFFTAVSLIPDKKDQLYTSLNDTLMKIENNRLLPLALIEYGNKFDFNTNRHGMTQVFQLVTSNSYLLMKQELDFQTSEQATSIRIETKGYYKIDKNNFQLTSIEKFYIDPLDYYRDEPPSFWKNNKKIAIQLNAVTIKEIAQTKREKGETLSPELERLDRELKEEDNPVLIVGDLK